MFAPLFSTEHSHGDAARHRFYGSLLLSFLKKVVGVWGQRPRCFYCHYLIINAASRRASPTVGCGNTARRSSSSLASRATSIAAPYIISDA